MKKWSVYLFLILLLGLLAMGGCQKNIAPENLTPDQQEISVVLETWEKGWNTRNIGIMESIYDPASAELEWLKYNLSTRNSRIKVSVKEFGVFGDDAIVRTRIYGDWSSKSAFALTKLNGQWKVQARTNIK